MRKVLITTAITALLITGCTKETIETDKTSEEVANVENTVIIIDNSEDEAFQESGEAIPELIDIEITDEWFTNESVDPSNPKSLIEFIETHKGIYGTKTMDQLAEKLLNTLENHNSEDYTTEALTYLDIFGEEKMLTDESYLALIKDNSEFKTFVDKLETNGFKITYSVHWSPFVDVAYENVAEMFDNCVSEEMATYLAILGRESSDHYIKSSYDDMDRGISLDELSSRILMTENFLDAYPESSKIEIISKYHTEYLWEYLYGNTKYGTSFDWMTDNEMCNLYKEFSVHYAKTISENEGSELAGILKKYLQSIKENGGVDRKNRVVESEDYILMNHIWTETWN